MSAPKIVTYIVCGAGNRGKVYSLYAKEHPELAECVGVAEPREFSRNLVATTHSIPKENVFADWKEAAARPKFADAVVISTQDQAHCAPAIAFANKGYHILLEKPMSVSEDECKKICAAVEENNVMLAICHVMRYTPYSRKIKELVSSGAIGKLINVQHLEPIGFCLLRHFAHSYVRGNWKTEATSSFSLMTKSCHDVDWIRWIVDAPCKKLSSFGNLTHFRKENKPAGAADRCIECPVESQCVYSAKRIYMDNGIMKGIKTWPVMVLEEDPTIENITQHLKTGPYGLCVYGATGNDVVDHQVVNMEFENGVTASFSMVAFSEEICVRKTRLFGTLGEIDGDGHVIHYTDFRTMKKTTYNPGQEAKPNSNMRGHEFGDYWLAKNFFDAVSHNDPSRILSGPRESLESHLMVFAAEKSRRQNQVVSLH